MLLLEMRPRSWERTQENPGREQMGLLVMSEWHEGLGRDLCLADQTDQGCSQQGPLFV